MTSIKLLLKQFFICARHSRGVTENKKGLLSSPQLFSHLSFDLEE